MFDKATYLSLLLKFNLSLWLSNSLLGPAVPIFLEFINIISVLFCNFIELIMMLYTFLLTSFSQYKEYMIWFTSISKISDVLPAFTYANTIGNLWSIFVLKLIFWVLLNIIFCFVFSFRYDFRIIIKQFDIFFLWFVKCFNIFLLQFFSPLIYSFHLLFYLWLIFFIIIIFSFF